MASRGSTRERRKPQNVYDTSSLATEEQLRLSQESRENPGGAGEEMVRGRSLPSARRGRGVGGSRAGGKAKGRSTPGRKRGQGKEQGEAENYYKDREELGEAEEEKEAIEEQEQEDAAESPELGKRMKSGGGGTPAARGKRKASTPSSRNASRVSKTKPFNDDDFGESEEAEAEAKAEKFSSRGGAAGVGGDGYVLSPGVESENTLLEAVNRNAALQTVVADWVSSFERDESGAMVTLLNFLLLACGAPCTHGPHRPPEGVELNEMDAKQWAELMQEVTDDIQQAVGQEASGGKFPLAPAAKGKAGKAARTFRANFCEVFQRMAEACRRGMGHNTNALFAVTDLLVALSQQASDDVRFVATMAAMELGLGVAEGLADLHAKLAVGQRQLEVVTAPPPSPASGKGGRGKGKAHQPKARKTKGLQDQVQRISSAIEGLTEVSDKVFSRVTQKRYRDVSHPVRTAVLEGLCSIMLALPEVHVEDKLMRYFGWSLSAKPPAVRTIALQAIQRLLKDDTARVRLGKFSGHFFARVKDMLNDVDPGICREAAIALRLMLSAGFLENMSREDEIEIERNIFETDLPLTARAECMAFFVDRLEEFVETDAERAAASMTPAGGGKQKSKGKSKGSGLGSGELDEDEGQIALVRLESLAQLINLHANDGSADSYREGDREATYEERLACADAAVQALWCLPQAHVVRRWSALCKLLNNEEAGGEGGDRVGEVGGALDGGEQTIIARILLTSAKMTYGEATTGRRKTGGWILSKDAKQEIRESVSELAEICLTHLPNLLAKYQSDDAKLAILAELPVHLPRQALASLVSGVGKAAFSDLLSRTKDAFLMSNSKLVVDAAAASLRSFLEADLAKRAEVEALVQGMMEELFSKACSLCEQDDKLTLTLSSPKGKRKRGNDRAWRDTSSSLASCLRRLRALVGGVDPISRVTASGMWELWEGVKGAAGRRCRLDQVLPPKTPPSQHRERLDSAREIVEEGCNVLFTLFLWRISPLFDQLRREGLSTPSLPAIEEEAESVERAESSEGGGDDNETSPPKKRIRREREKGGSEHEEEAQELGDGVLEMEEELTEETLQTIVECRDGLIEVLRGMLSVHQHPRQLEGEGTGVGKHSQDDIEGTVGVLTPEQKLRLVGPARRAAWKSSNELQTVLKAFLKGVEGPLASLVWIPDTSFTHLLQEHFEAEEEAVIAGEIRRKRRRSKESKKNVLENGLKAEKGLELEDDDEGNIPFDDGDDADVLDEPGGNSAGKQKPDERDLLLPLMKSIYSNVDRLSRRQAAAVLAHLVNSSPEAGALAKCFISKLKEYNIVRCLEVHMATMRVFYVKWVPSASRELEEEADDSESEKRRSALDEAGLRRWITLVHRLSMSLGLGPLRSKDSTEQANLQDTFLRFMKEGVRFALQPEGEWLLFLEGMREYIGKVPPRHRKILAIFFDQEAKGLRNGVLEEGKDHAFHWVDEQVEHNSVPPRWRAYFSFRASLSPGDPVAFVPEIFDQNPGSLASSSPSTSIGRSSYGTPASRVSSGSKRARPGSVKSRMSTTSELFPVEEEEEERSQVDDDDNEADAAKSSEGEAGGQDQRGDDRDAGALGQRMGEMAEDSLMDVEEEEEEDGSVVSEVHTPNRRRLDESERFEEAAEGDEAGDLFEDLALNQ